MTQENQQGKRSGCSRPVVVFFIAAIVIVAAFLIVGLVRTCESDHEEENLEKVEQMVQTVEQSQGEAQTPETPAQ